MILLGLVKAAAPLLLATDQESLQQAISMHIID